MDGTVWISIVGTSISIFTLFLYCYFGEMATGNFEEMADQLYETNWPDFPVKFKKSIIVMIGNMQRNYYYHGFGLVNMDLAFFITVSI